MLRPILAALALIPLLLATAGEANGPLYVGGPADLDGLPFHWAHLQNNTLEYWTDPGSLGMMGKSQADELVADAFGAWQSVQTETLQFKKAGDLSADVTAANILSVLDGAADCSTLPGPPAGNIARQVTIIFDSDGSALRALGLDPSVILGFANAFCFAHDATNNYFQRGYAVLNGQFSSSPNHALQMAMTHEFGHMIGLDHSQVNLNCLSYLTGCVEDGSIAGVPLMFPIYLDTGRAPLLAADDIAGVSNLYPSSTYASTTGEIKGHIYFSDGVTPAQGLNVVARNVDDPGVVAISTVSGNLFTGCIGVPTNVLPAASQDCDPDQPQSGNGSWNKRLQGTYDLKGLPPGTYTVEVEAISNSGDYAFIYGSGLNPLGPYGFQFTLPATPGPGPHCNPEYLSTSDVCTLNMAARITLGGGDIKSTDTDIILFRTPPRYDAWEDEP